MVKKSGSEETTVAGRKRGRQYEGKRGNPEFRTVASHVSLNVYNAAKRELETSGERLSNLFEPLLKAWLKERRTAAKAAKAANA